MAREKNALPNPAEVVKLCQPAVDAWAKVVSALADPGARSANEAAVAVGKVCGRLAVRTLAEPASRWEQVWEWRRTADTPQPKGDDAAAKAAAEFHLSLSADVAELSGALGIAMRFPAVRQVPGIGEAMKLTNQLLQDVTTLFTAIGHW